METPAHTVRSVKLCFAQSLKKQLYCYKWESKDIWDCGATGRTYLWWCGNKVRGFREWLRSQCRFKTIVNFWVEQDLSPTLQQVEQVRPESSFQFFFSLFSFREEAWGSIEDLSHQIHSPDCTNTHLRWRSGFWSHLNSDRIFTEQTKTRAWQHACIRTYYTVA